MRRRMTVAVAVLGTALMAATAAPATAGSRAVVPEQTVAELDRLDELFATATPGSPAQFRIVEERDRIRARFGM